MIQDSIKFFIPDVVGGVGTVVNNYIKYLDKEFGKFKIEVIKTRNRSRDCEYLNFEIPNAANHIFEYSSVENRYFVHKSLIRKYIQYKNIIVATDYLELAAIHEFGLRTTVHFLVLGDFKFYYDLAIKHESIIDTFIAISDDIYNNLVLLLPQRENDIFKVNYGVADAHSTNKEDEPFKIIFVARLTEGKGVDVLLKIDQLLRKEDIKLSWTIIGDGPERTKLEAYNTEFNSFKLRGFLTYEELLREYPNNHIYILPSKNEGMPISMVEAMKYGLVPIVNDIKGGIRDVIIDGNNGYLVQANDPKIFAKRIGELNSNKTDYHRLRNNAIRSSNECFNPHQNSSIFFSHILNKKGVVKPDKPATFRPQSRLDRSWIPNQLVMRLRNWRSN